MKVGAQLYSLHEYTQTLEGFSETLKRVADMGYTSVQVSGTCAYEPEWLSEQLKATGLTCDLTHYDLKKVLAAPEKVTKDHLKFGCKYIGLGYWANKETARWTDLTEPLKPALEVIKANGGYFMYHNHASEYNEIDGLRPIDFLKDEIPADLMGFTLDTHWIKRGGDDPVSEFKRFAGRIPCVHYKDLITMPDGEVRFAPVGFGELDFEEIIRTSLDIGVEFAFVEQDTHYGEDAFQNMKKSYEYLKSMGLK